MSKNTLEYNYRVRSNSDENPFGYAKSNPLPHYPFSLPPKYDGEEFKIIERPDIPELDNFVERYLDVPNKEKESEKNIKIIEEQMYEKERAQIQISKEKVLVRKKN